jgi:AcrR family transcriptional regulator
VRSPDSRNTNVTEARGRGEYASHPVPGEAPKRRGRPPSGGREAILAAALELLRDRGIARLTTREIAAAAGVSEASIFYHYRDRAGLLMAVFEQGLVPLKELSETIDLPGPDISSVLATLGPALERFLDQGLPVLTAAQSDIELRDALLEYMSDEDLGPHRGVIALGTALAEGQKDGRIRADIDPQAVALMFVGACFIRASQRQMPIHKVELPELDGVIDSLTAMLRPPTG